ncbi:ER membrane protein DP1/Yop1 [Rhodotorula kratochvilovae]
MASAQQKFDYYISQVDKELSKYPSLNKLEAQTGVPKAYATLGVAGVFVTFVFFNIAAGFLTNLLGWGLPAYLSLKALETPGHDDDVQWLTYWVIFGSFTFLENFAGFIVSWFPYYYVVKTIFILYLILPSTRGAVVVHEKIVRPAFHQRKVAPTSTTTTSTTSITTPVAAAQ